MVFEGDNIADYADREITEIEQTIDVEQQPLTSFAIETYHSASPTIKQVLPTTVFGSLVMLVSVLVVGTGLKLLALTANLLLVQYVAEKCAYDLRALFFRKALHLDLDSFGENGSADLTARLTNDVSQVSGGISVLLGRMIREPLKMAVSLFGALFIRWQLLLMVLIFTPILILVMRYLSRAIRRASRKLMEEMSQIYGMLNDAFAGIRVVKAFNTQAHERAKFNQCTSEFFRKSMKMAFYNTLARSSSEMIGMTTVGLAILARWLSGRQRTNQLVRNQHGQRTDECRRGARVLRFSDRCFRSREEAIRRLGWSAAWESQQPLAFTRSSIKKSA